MNLKITLIMCLAVLFSGCSNKNNQVEEQASEIVTAFSSNDINQINRLMGFVDESDTSFISGEDGILSDIFTKTDIEIDNVDNAMISYRISAPDMSGVFTDNLEQLSEMDESELEEYIKQYAQDAERVENTVTLEYTIEDEDIVIDYTSQDFVDAITGGLLQAYIDLYRQIIEEYEELVNESN